MTADALLEHWQGHRRLTRKMIEAFPDDKLFTYSIGGMRPLAELAMETLRVGPPGVNGVVVGTWPTWNEDGVALETMYLIYFCESLFADALSR